MLSLPSSTKARCGLGDRGTSSTAIFVADDKTGDEVKYGFSEDEAVGCFQRATYLRNMRPRHLGERGGKGWQHKMICASPRSRIPCPRAPRKETDIAVVDKFAPALSGLLTPQSDLIPVLRYYADSIWQRRNQLFFHNPNRPEAAIAYLKLLEGMGINRKQASKVAGLLVPLTPDR